MFVERVPKQEVLQMKGFKRKIYYWIYDRRPWVLLTTVAATIAFVALLNLATGSDLFRQFFFPKVCDPKFPAKCDPLEWKELFQAAVLILGLPIAFLIWHWRDVNVREQLENARKDINLKEFQEVQIRAAGALDQDMSREARAQLQIAALHHLRGFLKGDYGESFKLPAFELFCAGLGQAKVLSFGEWRKQNGDSAGDLGRRYAEYVDAEFEKLDQVSLTRNRIISEEWRQIFRSGFPLRQRNFSFVPLPFDADLSGLDLSGCRFIRSGLDRVNFRNSTMSFAVLDRAFANGANFSNVLFFGASMVYCGLSKATNDSLAPRTKAVDFRGANLNQVNFGFVSILGAQLQGAKLHTNALKDQQFIECQIDHTTELDMNWSIMPDEQKETLRKQWIDHGAIYVDPSTAQSEMK